MVVVLLAYLEVSRTVALCLLGHTLGHRFVLEQPLGSLMERHPRFAAMTKLIHITRHSTSMDQFDTGTRKPTWLYSNCATITGIDEFGPPLPRRSASSEERVVAISYEDLEIPLRKLWLRARVLAKWSCMLALSEVCVTCCHDALVPLEFADLHVGPAIAILHPLQDAQGAKRFKGGPGLKSTQVYSKCFGQALVLCHRVSQEGMLARYLGFLRAATDHVREHGDVVTAILDQVAEERCNIAVQRKESPLRDCNE